MSTLFGTKIKDTYDGLLKVSDNVGITSTKKIITDGLGNDSSVYISSEDFQISTFFYVDINSGTPTASKIGLGTSSPTTTLHIVGDLRLTARFYDGSNSAGTSGRVLMSTGAATSWSNTFTTAMTFDAGVILNAGIKDYTGSTGTSNQILSSTGSSDVEWVSLSEISGVDGTGVANKLAYWLDTETITYNNLLHWDSSNNRLGVGTATPQTKLEVNGSFRVSSGNEKYLDIGDGSYVYKFGDIDGGEGNSYLEIDSNNSESNLYKSTLGIPTYIFHQGNTTTKFGFSTTDTFVVRTNDVERFSVNNSGVALAGGSRVTTILDEDDMASDSDTSLATQQSIKAFVESEIAAVPSGLNFQGNWNADTNSPTLASGSGTVGHFYNVSTPGSTSLNGETDWKIGDWAVFVEAGGTDKWMKIDNTSVLSGVGSANKIAYWSNDSTLTYDTDFYVDGNTIFTTNLEASGTAVAGSVRTPTITTGSGASLFIKPNASGHIYLGDSANGTNLYHYSASDDGKYTTYDFNGNYYRISTTATSGVWINDPLIIGGNTEVQNSQLKVRDTSSNLQLLLQASVGGNARIMAHNTNLGTNQNLDIKATQIDLYSGSISGGTNVSTLLLDSSNNATFAGTLASGNISVTGGGGGNGQIDVLRTSGANVRIQSQTATGVLGVTTNHPLHLKTNDTTRVTIAADGKIGIGTTSPDYLLDVSSGASNDAYIQVRNADDNAGAYFKARSGFDGYYGIEFFDKTTAKWYIGGYGANRLGFWVGSKTTASNEKMSLTTDGRLGIGTISPSSKLHIESGGAGNAFGSCLYLNGDTATNYPAMRIDNATGGNSTETHGLLINNTAAGAALRVNQGTTNAALIVDGSGNIGINTATPTAGYKLDVSGSLRVTGDSIYTNNVNIKKQATIGEDGVAGTQVLKLQGNYSSSGNVKLIEFYRQGGAVAGDLNYTDATTDMEFGTATAHSFSLKTGGTRALTINNSQNATFVGDVTIGALTSGQTAQLVVNHEGGASAVAKFMSRTNRSQVQISDNDTNGYLVAEGDVFSIGRTASSSANNINIDSSHNVGIGTTSPDKKLRVDGDIKAAGDFIGSGLTLGFAGTASIITNDTNENLLINPNGTGKVGIGTTSPSEKLHVATSNNTVAKFESTDANANIRIGDTIDNTHIGTDGGKTYIGADTSVGGNNLTILSDGSVGIGTGSPSKKLDVIGNIRAGTDGNSAAEIDVTSGATWRLRSNPVSGDNLYGLDIIKGSAGTDIKMAIDTNGNVQARRTRSNTAGEVALSLQPTDSTIHYGFRIDQANNYLNIDRVDSAGNLMILDYNGNATFASNVTLNSRLTFDYNGSGTGNNYLESGTNTWAFKNSGGTSALLINHSDQSATFSGNITGVTETLTGTESLMLTLNPTANNYGGIWFKYGGASKGMSVYNSGSMVYGGESGVGTILQTNGQHALNIDTSQNVGIGTASPSAKLEVKSSGGDEFFANFIPSTGSGYAKFYQSSNNHPSLYMASSTGTASIVLNSSGVSYLTSGNLIIGGSADSGELLQVEGTSSFSGNATFSGDVTIAANNDYPILQLLRDGDNTIANQLLGRIQFMADYDGSPQNWGRIELDTNASAFRTDMDFYVKSTDGLELLTMKLNGTSGAGGNVIVYNKLGIGTTSPNALLSVTGSGDAIRVESTNTGSGGAQIDLLHFTTSPADEDIHAVINMGGYYAMTSSVYGSQIKSIWTDVSERHSRLEFNTCDTSLQTTLTLAHDKSATFAGKVGVGGKSPAYGLSLAQGTGVNNKIAWTDVTPDFAASIYASSSTDKLTFATKNASNAETTALEIDTSQNATFAGSVDATNYKINGAQGSDGQVLTSTGSGVAWETPSGGGSSFNGGTITNNLTISNASPALNLTDTDNSSNIAISSVGGALIVNPTSDQVYQIGGSEKMRLTTTGLGIGTTSPSTNLEVYVAGKFKVDVSAGSPIIDIVNNSAVSSTSGTATLKFTQGNTQTGGKIVSGRDGNYSSGATRTSNLQFYTSTNASDTEKMRITSDGDMGIGTNSPDAKLHIYKATAGSVTASSDAQLVVENSGVAAINLLSPNTSHGQIIFGDPDDNDVGQFGYDHSDNLMYFKVNGSNTKIFKVESGGATFNGNIHIDDDTSQLQLGADKDMVIYHSGTNGVFDNMTGHLYIQNNSNDKSIYFQTDDGSGGVTTYMKIDGVSEYTEFTKASKHMDGINAIFGSSADANIYHNGTNSWYFIQQADNGYIDFRNDDGSGNTTSYLVIDGNSELNRFYKRVQLEDNVKLTFGNITTPDLEIYHDGSNSYITDTGTGSLKVGAANFHLMNAAHTEYMMTGTPDEGIILYYDGSTRFLTTTSGVEVNGGLYVDTGIYHNGDTNNYIYFSTDTQKFYTSGSERMRIDSSGRVGIGTTSLSEAFVVSGNIELKLNEGMIGMNVGDTWGDSDEYCHYGLAKPSGAEAMMLASYFGLKFGTNGSERLEIAQNGKINCGSATRSNTTSSFANMYMDSTSGEIKRSTSSRRYKTNIVDYTKGLDEVLQLQPKTYNDINGDSKQFAGLIAEDVHDLGLNEYVYYNENNEPDALGYSHMIALLTNAIKELKQENDNLKARVSALEN